MSPPEEPRRPRARRSAARRSRPYTVSPSDIGLLAECPLCGWLKARRVPRPGGSSPSLPKGVEGAVRRQIDLFRPVARWPPLLAGRLPGAPFPAALGRRLVWEEAGLGVRLAGRVDEAAELPGGSAAVVMLRTRGFPLAGVHPAHARLASLSRLLLASTGLPVVPEAFIVYLHPGRGASDGGLGLAVEVARVRGTPEDARPLLASASAVLHGPCPSPAPGCGFCRWREAVAAERRKWEDPPGEHSEGPGLFMPGPASAPRPDPYPPPAAPEAPPRPPETLTPKGT